MQCSTNMNRKLNQPLTRSSRMTVCCCGRARMRPTISIVGTVGPPQSKTFGIMNTDNAFKLAGHF